MRTVWLGIVFGLMACLPVGARQDAKTPVSDNVITAEDAARGWIQLFDGTTDFGWKARSESKWNISGGTIQVSDGPAAMLCTTTEFSDFVLQAEVWIDGKANSGIFLRCPTAGAITADNAYEVNVYDPHPQWPTGSINTVAKTRSKFKSVGKWTKFNIRAEGERLTVIVDNKIAVDTLDQKHARGAIALQYSGAGTVRYRNLRLLPLGLKSLFNGKDLTGWKPIPAHPSVFTVTQEGWLNIKNGNGDIQSEAEFGDFMLQTQVFSNGDHLNSGLFFRANKGLFWSGYEDQIRNQWEGEDRSKAVDYGTGGIYNRQPARRVISSDREWFTMTLIAHGLHIASWVNGVQVADFTDTRPVNEGNAREGARTKPGVLSLQGHDPTTDLSFRSIRVVELPPAGK